MDTYVEYDHSYFRRCPVVQERRDLRSKKGFQCIGKKIEDLQSINFAGSIELVNEFLFDEWEDKDIEFYVENDLEDAAIAEIARWVQ